MFGRKDLESKIQDDLRLDQECYPETEVESFMLKVLVSDQLLLFQLTRVDSRKRPALVTTTLFQFPRWSFTRASTVVIKTQQRSVM